MTHFILENGGSSTFHKNPRNCESSVVFILIACTRLCIAITLCGRLAAKSYEYAYSSTSCSTQGLLLLEYSSNSVMHTTLLY